MLLACPACDTRFRIDPGKIGEGRKVRCSRCAKQWLATRDDLLPETDETFSAILERQESLPEETMAAPASFAAAIEAEPDFDAIEADMLRRRRSDARRSESRANAAPVVSSSPARGSRSRGWKAVAAALLLLNFIAAIYALRDPLLAHAGFTAPLYAALGYGDTSGLKLGDVQLVPKGEGKERAFDISGSIYNTTETSQPYPVVEVSMLGANETVLKSWRFQADEEIPPGKAHVFRSREDKKLTNYNVDKAEAFRIRLGSPRELGLRP